MMNQIRKTLVLFLVIVLALVGTMVVSTIQSNAVAVNWNSIKPLLASVNWNGPAKNDGVASVNWNGPAKDSANT